MMCINQSKIISTYISCFFPKNTLHDITRGKLADVSCKKTPNRLLSLAIIHTPLKSI